MTLEEFTSIQNINLSLEKANSQQMNAELKVKKRLHEIKVLLNSHQSDFP